MQWLITGCSTGLGLELARAVLSAGEKCIATSRTPSKTPEAVAEIEKLGGTWAALDVASPSLETDFANIVKAHGPIDVLVNNAGYAMGGVLETTSPDAARIQFETNFFGAMRLIQSSLPSMRAARSGTIVNISSSTFWNPPPTVSIYAASKFALEGLSEALAGELASFQIRMLIVEPGALRTAFLDPEKVEIPVIPEGYRGTVAEYMLKVFQQMHGNQDQDPKKTAEAVVEEVLRPAASPPVLRLPWGKESLGAMKKRAETFLQTAQAIEKVALGCDF